MSTPPTASSPPPVPDLVARSAIEILQRHGDHSSMALALNQGVDHFLAPGEAGMVAYRRIGKTMVQICGPFCPPEQRERTLESFLGFARDQGCSVVAVQLRRCDVDAYAERGFSVNQFGCSYSIDLRQFTLKGTRFMKVRNKISRARRLGVTVSEASDGGEDPELSGIDSEWLRGKGRHVNELSFLVGERGGSGAPLRRIFVARLDEQPLAYVTYSPVLGSERPGWLYDLTRRRPSVPPGTIELIFVTALEELRERGAEWLHLGLTPFVGLAEEFELPARSALITYLGRQLAEHGEFVYPARSQETFKLKWAPSVIEPEYIAFQGGPSMRATLGLLRLTKVIPW